MILMIYFYTIELYLHYYKHFDRKSEKFFSRLFLKRKKKISIKDFE